MTNETNTGNVDMIAKLKAMIYQDMAQRSKGDFVVRNMPVIGAFAFNKCKAREIYASQVLYQADVLAACESLVEEGALRKFEINEKGRSGIYYQMVKRET